MDMVMHKHKWHCKEFRPILPVKDPSQFMKDLKFNQNRLE